MTPSQEGQMGVHPGLDPSKATTATEFVALMRQLKEISGLSYRQLERRASAHGKALPVSTLSTALCRPTLPREDLIVAFILACGEDPEEWVAARRLLVRNLVQATVPGEGGASGEGTAADAATVPGGGSGLGSAGDRLPDAPDVQSVSNTQESNRPGTPSLFRSPGHRFLLVGTGAVMAALLLAAVALWGRGQASGTASRDLCVGSDLRKDPKTLECWGISDGDVAFQPSNATLAKVIQRIHQQNQASAAAHSRQPQRPWVTLAYMGVLTFPRGYPADLVAERKTLAGIATAQRLYLERSTPRAPLVRIVIANGGAGMAHGVDVARMLARRSDVMGVVGLDRSRQSTLDTVSELGRNGIPMVAAALSADQLTEASPLYFQVAPQNKRSAAVAAAYVAEAVPRFRAMRVYLSSDPADLYSRNIDADLSMAFGAKGMGVEHVPFRPGAMDTGTARDAYQAGGSACGYRGVVFYAARTEDFSDFLHGIYAQCGKTPPHILAGDDVSRYAADPALRAMYPSIPFQYMSFAMAPSLCTKGDEDTFYSILYRIFPFECEIPGSSLDGHAALGYDAVLTMLTAIENTGDQVSRAELAKALTQVRVGGAASAPIIMTSTRIPSRKMVAILNVTHGGLPVMEAACGEGVPGPRWCPR